MGPDGRGSRCRAGQIVSSDTTKLASLTRSTSAYRSGFNLDWRWFGTWCCNQARRQFQHVPVWASMLSFLSEGVPGNLVHRSLSLSGLSWFTVSFDRLFSYHVEVDGKIAALHAQRALLKASPSLDLACQAFRTVCCM